MPAQHFMVYQDGQKHRYGSTSISEIQVDPILLQVEQYVWSNGKFTGQPAFQIRVDQQICESINKNYRSTQKCMGRLVIYGLTRKIQVDP